MIRIPRSLQVGLASSVAVALIAAGAHALLADPASADAGTASVLTITPVYPTDNTAAAGTCMIYRAMPTTGLGQLAADSGTVVITLKESPESASQDVDFCLPPTVRPANVETQGGTQVNHGYYTNSTDAGPPPVSGGTQTYCAGESITPPAVATCTPSGGATNNPDKADDASFPSSTNPGPSTNPSGTDSVNDVKYNNDPATPDRRWIEFGVVGLTAGKATIDACIDRNSSKNCSSSTSNPDVQATQVTATFTAGGQPDSNEAYNAVTNITSDRTSYSAVQAPFTPAPIDLTLLNASTDTVFGVTPNFRVQSGPNANSTIRSCTRSTDFGQSRCSYVGTPNVGTDTLLIWVNHTAAPGSTATGGPDSGEPQLLVTVTTYAQPAPAATARNIDLQPDSPVTTTAGQQRDFAGVVTDTSGTPVQGVQVTFSETGPGQISGGLSPDGNTSSRTVPTGPDGRATITVTTQPGESGSETVTATLSASDTQCGALFNGQPGKCSDSTTNTIGGGPSPTPTRTGTPTPSGTGSPGGRRALSISTSTPDIQPTQGGVINVAGQPSASVELRCYTRPSTSYVTARGPQNLTSSGTWQFQINPGANTRCYARYAGDEPSASTSVVISVHTSLSLSAYRDGVRRYHFQGTNLPRRAGQLITLYRWARRDTNGYCDPHIASGDYTASSSDPNCVAVRTATATTNSSNVWRIDRSFTGSGQFVFQVRTSTTLTNANGVSNPRLTIIH